jgi:DNA repair protein SbcD/Mre11
LDESKFSELSQADFMAMKVLAVGDMHLGRRPSRLPPALADRAVELGPAGAWRRVVEHAIAEQVDVVALAGDVVERENDFYEAYRELEKGVAELARAGVYVLGVAGNHDVQVLPRLADQIEDFDLLGRGGAWESVTIEAGGEALTLWGWSFPQRQVTRSPLDGHRFARAEGLNLGLLHCDRDQPGSPYAPVMSRELAAAGLDGWLLGHIHAPDALAAPSPSGYLGSVTGMDPGEPGARGPWLLTIERGRIREVTQHVLAPLRWEPVELDLTGIARPEEVQDRLLERLRALDETLGCLARPPQAMGIRLRLTGRTRHGEAVEAALGKDTRDEVPVGGSDCHYFVERVVAASRPEIPLADLAARGDPLGLLARRLQSLDAPGDDPERAALIAAARRRLEARAKETRWQGLDGGPMDDAAVADWLRRAAMRLLERMLAQREDAA